MNIKIIALRLIFDELNSRYFEGKPVLGKNSTFESRLIVQKIIYLLQKMGLNFAYSFEWDAYGPFSAELSEHLRTTNVISSEVPREIRNFGISPEGKAIIGKFTSVIDTSRIKDPEFLEALASMVFIRSNMKKEGRLVDREASIGRFKAGKPKFAKDKSMIDKVYSLAQDFQM